MERDFTPPSFEPGPEPCVLPTVVDQKGRLVAGGVTSRTRDTGKEAYIQCEWFYYDDDQYKSTTDVNDITFIEEGTSVTLPDNLPKVVYSFWDGNDENPVNFSVSQYVTVLIPPPLPAPASEAGDPVVPVTTYFSALPGIRAMINYESYVNIPEVDNVTSHTSENDPLLLGHFPKTKTTFMVGDVDGTFVIAGEPSNPAEIRTGPTLTLAFLASSEKGNTAGEMVEGVGTVAYDYANGEWVPQ